MEAKNIIVMYANESHAKYAEHICRLIYESAQQRGTGIAKRTPEYIIDKMKGGKAVVAEGVEAVVVLYMLAHDTDLVNLLCSEDGGDGQARDDVPDAPPGCDEEHAANARLREDGGIEE